MNVIYVWFLLTGSILLTSCVSTAEIDESIYDDNDVTGEDTDYVASQSNYNDVYSFILPWTINVTCDNGLPTWNSCLTDAIESWSSVSDVDKRDCCTCWHLLNCWFNQVKTVCPDINPSLAEQSRIRLSNQTKCVKYYDISVCKAKPLPIWANILILATGATVITGAAVFVYWRWIRLI
uniref:Uncharacterized protein n=1 Tax=Tetranychus urticae TaxID=32264 RepID=T1L1Y4_TETUR